MKSKLVFLNRRAKSIEIAERLGRNAGFIFSIVLTALLLCSSDHANAQITVEQVQRDFQVRYHTLTGGYLTWPNCSAGTPAPNFPKNGFYGDLTGDPSQGVVLVQDLVKKFYSDNVIFNQFVNDSSGLEGVSQIPMYTGADMHALDPAGVDTNNFQASLANISDDIKKLIKVKVQAGGQCLKGKCIAIGIAIDGRLGIGSFFQLVPGKQIVCLYIEPD